MGRQELQECWHASSSILTISETSKWNSWMTGLALEVSRGPSGTSGGAHSSYPNSREAVTLPRG